MDHAPAVLQNSDFNNNRFAPLQDRLSSFDSFKKGEKTRNVCLEYNGSSANRTKKGKVVESLCFVTADSKDVEVTFYNTKGVSMADKFGLQNGKMYTVMHTFCKEMTTKDLEYCDIRLHATPLTRFVAVVDENNN